MDNFQRILSLFAVCFDSWPIPEFLPLQEPGADEAISLKELRTMMRRFMSQGVHNKDVMTDCQADLD